MEDYFWSLENKLARFIITHYLKKSTADSLSGTNKDNIALS